MLFLNTIDPELYQVLSDFCSIPELANFSLAGGTSLSLQLGHRKSDDLDFFTDHSFDIRPVKEAILRYNSNVLFLSETPQGISFSLPLPGKTDDARKLDIYNWAVKFIRPVRKEGTIRLASLEDIAAFKLDAICHRKEKKDYIDIAVLLEKFSFEEMLRFYREKFPMNEARIVLSALFDTEGLENSVDPAMLKSLAVEEALQQIHKAAKEYSTQQINAKSAYERKRLQDLEKMIKQRNENKPSHKKGRRL